MALVPLQHTNTIDDIYYVTGIGNSSREQYICAGDPCRFAHAHALHAAALFAK